MRQTKPLLLHACPAALGAAPAPHCPATGRCPYAKAHDAAEVVARPASQAWQGRWLDSCAPSHSCSGLSRPGTCRACGLRERAGVQACRTAAGSTQTDASFAFQLQATIGRRNKPIAAVANIISRRENLARKSNPPTPTCTAASACWEGR